MGGFSVRIPGAGRFVRYALPALLGVLLLAAVAGMAGGVGAPTRAVAADNNLWVNFDGYNNAGGGFWWDPISGQVWTSELGWHLFASRFPQPGRTLWVNDVFYGSESGGLYLDPLSNQVWTAEKGWEYFDPMAPLEPAVQSLLVTLLMAAADPSAAATLAVTSGQVLASSASSREVCSNTDHLGADVRTVAGGAETAWVVYPGQGTKVPFAIGPAAVTAAVLQQHGVLTSQPGSVTITRYAMHWDRFRFFAKHVAFVSFRESDCDPNAPPRSAPIPVPPTSLTLTVLSETSIRVDWAVDTSAWSDANRPDGFRVVQTSPGSTVYPDQRPTLRTYTVTGLKPDTRYCFTVRAFKGSQTTDATPQCESTKKPNYVATLTPERGAGGTYRVGETIRLCYHLSPETVPYDFFITSNGGPVTGAHSDGVNGGGCVSVGVAAGPAGRVNFELSIVIDGQVVALAATYITVI